ncbi:MAG: M67 family metallopeptidase [Tepidisphaeraceae bacterium]|jgi:proteasome lid subunit RPN8/RPN11
MSAASRLILTAAQIRQIEREGSASYPSECCGAMLGMDQNGAEGVRRVVKRLEPLKNSFVAEEQFHRFSLDPKELMDLEKRSGEAKLAVLGFYHSHPDHPARPSEYDRQHAWPFYSYVIVEIAGGKPAELTSWQLDANSETFTREEIVTEQERSIP